jgi:hypothetical protein
MYKILVKVKGKGNPSIRKLINHGFIPLFFKKYNNDVEYYIVLYRGSLVELKESLVDLAFELSKEGKVGGKDYAIIYEVNDKYIGKLTSGSIGSIIGYSIFGLTGLFLGLIGGLFLGELLDLELGEKYVGVVEWPMSVTT